MNIGLLAAKALDFDTSFIDYSQLLHNVWGSFLSFLNKPYTIPPSGPKKDVYKFYIKQGFTDNQAKNHMQGIDFLKKINTNFTLNKNDKVAQWRNPNILQQGNYYSESGKTPSCLGIHDEQEDYQGNKGKRVEHMFSLQKEITCLESHAAPVLDSWSFKGLLVLTQGGCVQYFNAKDKIQFQKI